MSEATLRPARPWHLTLTGWASLMWNAFGALDYTMTKLGNAAYLKDVPPATLEAIAHSPAWATAAWAVGVWGSLLGSILLLMSSRHALTAFVASLLGLALNTVNMRGMGLSVFSPVYVAIWIVLLALIAYSLRLKAKGELR